ncbi:MAG: helix-turn-helix domain-containing protein [Coriobacteriia bacterium]|nr:helix-turn-helix domain-containing protein [Coriobacteriia bacterium]
MVNRQNIYSPERVSAPGESLRKALAAVELSQTDFAEKLGKTDKFVSELINGKAPITPETAIHLERVLGMPASYWNNRERTYREWLARQKAMEELAAQTEWATCFPVGQMAKYEWIERRSRGPELVAELLEFFGIATPREWTKVWGGARLPAVAFRQSKSYDVDQFALSAWLRYGEVQAQRMACAEYDKDIFRRSLVEARHLTIEEPEVFQPALIELCCKAGVALVFAPDLPKTRVHAAARWISPRRALVQLGLRYKTDDHLWFSFFHEAAHILRHGKKLEFLETNGLSDEAEVEANNVAADMLVPPGAYRDFVAAGGFNKTGIRSFAESIGVAPGIVVGRLQHDGRLPYTHCNDLKRHFEWVQRPN